MKFQLEPNTSTPTTTVLLGQSSVVSLSLLRSKTNQATSSRVTMKRKASSFLHTSHLQNGIKFWPGCHFFHLTVAIILLLFVLINSTQATRSSSSSSPGEYMDVDYFNSGEEGDSYGMDSLGEFKLPIRQINYISPSELVPKSQFRHEEPLSFSAKGMDHLYLLNNFLMNLLQQSGLPNSILTDQLFTDPVNVAVQNRSKVSR